MHGLTSFHQFLALYTLDSKTLVGCAGVTGRLNMDPQAMGT